MLNHPTLDKLLVLKLTGMAKALSEQMDLPESQALSFEERLGLLVDREMTVRSDRRLTTRLGELERLRGCDRVHPAAVDGPTHREHDRSVARLERERAATARAEPVADRLGENGEDGLARSNGAEALGALDGVSP